MAKLPEENLDYKYLLKEYHDGILLFNLTNDVVWTKAQKDTIGLETFYKNKADKYQWNERIFVNLYKFKDNSFTSKLPTLIKKQVKKKLEMDFLYENLCPTDSTPCVELEKKTYEKGQDAFADKLTWEKGSYISESDDDWNYLYYVVNTKKKTDKTLSEAKGLYIADYQTYLENQWVKDLRLKYEVVINNEVLENLKIQN
jgi:peptidyl-prolyl cis-trans isomerase SurA